MKKLILLLFIPLVSFSQSAEDFFKQAYANYKSGNFENAVILFEKGLEIDPNETDAYILMAESKLYLSDFNGAITDLNKALSLNPKNAYAYFQRASARMMIDDNSGALQDLNTVLDLDYSNVVDPSRLFLNRGTIYWKLGLNNEACIDWKKADSLNNPKAANMISLICVNNPSVEGDY